MVIGLIYLILLISQLGKHFWFDWSFVSGVKIDYLSPTLYFVDLLWITALIFNFKFLILKQFLITNFFIKKRNVYMRSLLVGIFAFINIILANRWQVAVYGWFRLWQIWWWASYFSKDKKEVIKLLKWVIPWWIGIETILALGQVVNGGSLGGIFYWLGERKFDYMSLGIARISWFGDQYVRAYGSFSHPNSLAGFLLVGITAWDEIQKRSFSASWRIRMTLVGKVKRWLVVWIGVMGIILTGSRLVWGVGILILFLKCKIKLGWKMVFLGIFLMGASLVLDKLEIVGGWSVNSLDLRWKLLKSGWSMWRQNWLFGVGLNNFLVNLPEFMKGYWWLQPVHNIFVLFLTETGLLGLILIGSFLIKRIDFRKYAWVWLVIVMTGIFDHYWLTLPQNMGLLGLVMGLSKKRVV